MSQGGQPDHPPVRFYDSIECADSTGKIRDVLMGPIDRKLSMIAELEKWIVELKEKGGRGQNYIYITEREAVEIIALLKGNDRPVCKHEPYQGRCVHCNAKFIDGVAI